MTDNGHILGGNNLIILLKTTFEIYPHLLMGFDKKNVLKTFWKCQTYGFWEPLQITSPVTERNNNNKPAKQ